MTHPTPTGEERKSCCEKCKAPGRPCIFSHCECHTPAKEGWREKFDEKFDRGSALDGSVFFVPENRFSTRRMEIKSFIRQTHTDLLKEIEQEVEELEEYTNLVFPDPLIRKLDVLPIIRSHMKE